MSENGRAPAPTELVYVPGAVVDAGVRRRSASPGSSSGSSPAGSGRSRVPSLGLLALRKWIKDVADDLRRLPRHQDVTTAPLPATPMRSARG